MFPYISLLTRIIIAEAMQEQVTLALSVSDLPVFTSAELPKDSEVCRKSFLQHHGHACATRQKRSRLSDSPTASNPTNGVIKHPCWGTALLFVAHRLCNENGKEMQWLIRG